MPTDFGNALKVMWLRQHRGALSAIATGVGVSAAAVSSVYWGKIRSKRIEAALYEAGAPGFTEKHPVPTTDKPESLHHRRQVLKRRLPWKRVIRSMRRKRGQVMVDFAKSIRCTHPTISRLESGVVKAPALEIVLGLWRIATDEERKAIREAAELSGIERFLAMLPDSSSVHRMSAAS